MDYHTYSLFPDLLNFRDIAPTILRLTLALIFINLGFLKLHGERKGWLMFLRAVNIPFPKFVNSTVAIIEIVGGLMFIVGLYTQVVAIILGLLGLLQIFIESKEESLIRRSFVFYFLVIAICLSLLLTGPGIMAIDLPL
jgi:uncharacterized membrane protein YphA (DoxX/SURF4 family)